MTGLSEKNSGTRVGGGEALKQRENRVRVVLGEMTELIQTVSLNSLTWLQAESCERGKAG